MEFCAKAFFARVAQEGAERTFFQVSNGFLIKIYDVASANSQKEVEADPAESVIPASLLSLSLNWLHLLS